MAKSPKKSSLPDLEEISGVASKLFKDLKKSVTEIVSDYKSKREEQPKDKAPKKKPTKETAEKESKKE